MLIQLLKGLYSVLFDTKTKRSFETALISLVWAVTLFILIVSIPHGSDIISLSEHGDGRDIKATILASIIEIVPALLILIGFHAKGLTGWQKYTLISLAIPFVLLTAHIQLSFYAGVKFYPIYPIELALILPYGVCTCAVSVSFLWPLISQAASKLQEALDAVEAKWRIILSDKEQELDMLSRERDSARQELDTVTTNARQVIAKLEKELAKPPKEIAAPVLALPSRETIRAEVLKPYKDGKANQAETLDKLFSLLGKVEEGESE